MEKTMMYDNKAIWRVTYPIFLGLLAQNIINVTGPKYHKRDGYGLFGACRRG